MNGYQGICDPDPVDAVCVVSDVLTVVDVLDGPLPDVGVIGQTIKYGVKQQIKKKEKRRIAQKIAEKARKKAKHDVARKAKQAKKNVDDKLSDMINEAEKVVENSKKGNFRC